MRGVYDWLKTRVNRKLEAPAVERVPLDPKEVQKALQSEALWRDVRNYVRSSGVEDPDGVTQDVAMTAWSKIDHYEGKSAVKTWVFGIAVNTIRNKVRGATRARRALQNFTSIQRITEEGLAPTDVVQAVVDFQATLPPDQRDAWTLHFVHGMSKVELAEVIGRDLAWVETTLRNLESLMNKR